MYIRDTYNKTATEENETSDQSFCGELGFGPFQEGGLLTPCFNDMVLLTGAHVLIILGGFCRIVKVLQQPAFRNPKYYMNFWGFLFTLIILVFSFAQMVEGIILIHQNFSNFSYIVSFRVIQMVAWIVFFTVRGAEMSRFLPHSRLVLKFSLVVFVPATIKVYGMSRDFYGNIQPLQKQTFYPMYLFICFLTLESIFYFYLSFGRKIINPENLAYDDIPMSNGTLDLTKRRFFENWSGALTMAPKKLFAPRNAEEIVQIVKLAREYNQKVRVVGNGRTNNKSLFTDGFLVSLMKMNKLNHITPVPNEDNRYLVKVEAGKNMKEFFEELLNLTPPLCLPVTDDLWDFAVGGAIICGRHGSGPEYPTMSEYVVGMEMVTGTGEVLKIDNESDPELLNAARVSLGYMGIVYSLTLKLEPNYELHQEKRGANVDTVIKDLPEILPNTDHFEFYWFPHTDKCQTVRRHSIKQSNSESDPGYMRRFFTWYGENFVLGTLNRILERFPQLTPTILNIETWFLDQGDVRGPTSIIQSNVDPLEPYFEVEFAIPFDNGLSAFSELRDLIKDATRWEKPYFCNQNISVRFSKSDSAYLSPVYSEVSTEERVSEEEWKPDFMWIAFYGYDQYIRNTTDFFHAVQDIFVRKYGGRPSWPGQVYMTSLKRAQCFPKFSVFASFCKELDPDGIFRNSFLSDAIETFGEKPN